MKLLLLALLFFAHGSAIAWDLPIYVNEGEGKTIQHYLEFLNSESKRLSAILSPRAVGADASQTCRSVYNRVYDSKQIKIRVSLGYFDNRDADTSADRNWVWDKAFYFALRDHLMQPCKVNYFACGFRRLGKSPYQLTKMGQRPDGTAVEILLSVVPSSISWSDNWNKGDGNIKGAQTLQSKKARAHMMLGITDADVFFYMGHSRTGGGPDFNPPYLNKKGKTDYTRYKRERPGFHLMADTLKTSKTPPPKLVGFFSCDSVRWFDRLFREVAPDTGFIGTRFNPEKAKPTDQGLIAALDAVLGQRCQAGFEESLKIVEEEKSSKHFGKQMFEVRRLFRK